MSRLTRLERSAAAAAICSHNLLDIDSRVQYDRKCNGWVAKQNEEKRQEGHRCPLGQDQESVEERVNLFACRECASVFALALRRCPVCEHGPENSQPTMLPLEDFSALMASRALAIRGSFMVQMENRTSCLIGFSELVDDPIPKLSPEVQESVEERVTAPAFESEEQMLRWWNRVHEIAPWAWQSDPYLEGMTRQQFEYLRSYLRSDFLRDEQARLPGKGPGSPSLKEKMAEVRETTS